MYFWNDFDMDDFKWMLESSETYNDFESSSPSSTGSDISVNMNQSTNNYGSFDVRKTQTRKRKHALTTEQLIMRKRSPSPLYYGPKDVKTYGDLLMEHLNRGDKRQLSILLSNICSLNCSITSSTLRGNSNKGMNHSDCVTSQISEGLENILMFGEHIISCFPDGVFYLSDSKLKQGTKQKYLICVCSMHGTQLYDIMPNSSVLFDISQQSTQPVNLSTLTTPSLAQYSDGKLRLGSAINIKGTLTFTISNESSRVTNIHFHWRLLTSDDF